MEYFILFRIPFRLSKFSKILVIIYNLLIYDILQKKNEILLSNKKISIKTRKRYYKMSTCENNEIQQPANAIYIPFVRQELCDMDYIVWVFEQENIGKVSSVELSAKQVNNGTGHSVTVYMEEMYKNYYTIQTPWGEDAVEKTLCDDLREQLKGLRYFTIIPEAGEKCWVLKMADSKPKQYAFLPFLDEETKKKQLVEIHNELRVRYTKLVQVQIEKYLNALMILNNEIRSSFEQNLYRIRMVDIVINLYMHFMENFDILISSISQKGLFIHVAHLRSVYLLNCLNTDYNYAFAEDEVLKEKVNTAKTILADYKKLSIKYYVSTVKVLTPKLNNDVLTMIFDSLYSNLKIHPLEVIAELNSA